APQGDDCDKCEDSPSAAAEMGRAHAYFGSNEAEECGRNQAEQEKEEQDRLEDEHKGALIPMRVERKERTDAVVVCPVEKNVTEEREEDEEVEHSPTDRSCGDRPRGGTGMIWCITVTRAAATLPPGMNQPYEAEDDQSFDRKRDERMGNASMMLKRGDRTSYRPQSVEVWRFGGESHAQGGVSSVAVEACA